MAYYEGDPNNQQDLEEQRKNNTQPTNPMPEKNIKFTPGEQKALKNGCNTVGFIYLGYAIFCSLCAIVFLILSIICFSRPYYYGPKKTLSCVAVFLDFTVVAIVFYIKFAEYRKYARCVDGDTSIIINKFRGYSYHIAGTIVICVFFFVPAIIPVILTNTKISKTIKRMTAELN